MGRRHSGADTHAVPTALHGRLIGAGGAGRAALEGASGARVVFRDAPAPGACVVYGRCANIIQHIYNSYNIYIYIYNRIYDIIMF